MADITASTALRDFVASRLSTAGGCYYYATLHSSTGSAITAGQTYAASGIGELTNANGYTAGGVTAGTMTATSGSLDCPDVVWTTTSGQTLAAEYCALWVNTSASITGAKLVCLKNSSQTATNGGTLTAGFSNPIVIPTPA
jgi:hypothetical protein